jgi:hypothetical protein
VSTRRLVPAAWRRRVVAVALGMCAPLSAHAAPAPAAGPGPDALEAATAVVEDLLTRFEETAASHHVLLVKAPAARRESALQLVRMARNACAAGDTDRARLLLGWAAHFPGAWWYQTRLDARTLETVLEALEEVERTCEAHTGCTPYPAQGDGAEWKRFTRLAERRPYMPPATMAANGNGYETVLDFTHYPRGGLPVVVSGAGIAEVSAEIDAAVQQVRVPPALGVYDITAHTASGAVTHRYRAAVLESSGEGLRLNGAPWSIRAARLTGLETAIPESARAALTAAMQQGCNLGIVTAPPPWLLDLADELQLGLAVEPNIPGPETECLLCAGGTGIAGLQDRVAAHIARYAEAPAVRIWLALSPVQGDATAALHAVYPMYKHLDLYERPVAYLGEGDTFALDIALVAGDNAADTLERARKLDIPALALSNEVAGAAGLVAGEVPLTGDTP